MTRLRTLQGALADGQALFVSAPISILYLTGVLIQPRERFYGLLVTSRTAVLFVPELEATAARGFSGQVVPIADDEDLEATLASHRPAGTLAVEKRHLSVEWLELLQTAWQARDVGDLSGRLEAMRLIKDESELSAMRRACRIIDEVVAWALSQLQPGLTERQLAGLIDQRLERHYSVQAAFPSLVQFGADSALPHGEAGGRKLASGDAVLLDIGARVEGYPSDITRTAFYGTAPEQMRRIYQVVLEAHLAAAAALRPGAVAKEVDRAARDVIRAAGFGDKFTHRVGHGLGLEVHEPPSMHGKDGTVLAPGMVVTIEPGIYLPGVGGVRIEDDYLITAEGAERMTTADRQLREIEMAPA